MKGVEDLSSTPFFDGFMEVQGPDLQANPKHLFKEKCI